MEMLLKYEPFLDHNLMFFSHSICVYLNIWISSLHKHKHKIYEDKLKLYCVNLFDIVVY